MFCHDFYCVKFRNNLSLQSAVEKHDIRSRSADSRGLYQLHFFTIVFISKFFPNSCESVGDAMHNSNRQAIRACQDIAAGHNFFGFFVFIHRNA